MLYMLGCLHPLQAFSQSAVRQSRDDAWWTGPLLANGAETLPRGHFLLEPYLYDVTSDRSDGFASRTYVLYGLTDTLTIGLIPLFGYNRMSNGPDSSGIRAGDITLQAQYRLTKFHEGSSLPTISVMVQETLPTAKYDQLGDRPGDGLGGGAHTTLVGLNSQTYFWLPNGRILRARLNVAQTFSDNADIEGVSVYGTGEAFRGTARPGRSFSANAAVEYSLTRRWVMALDLIYSHNRNTRVTGYDILGTDAMPDRRTVRMNSGSSETFGFAPAIEYNWTPNLGVIAGARVILGGHGTSATTTPAVALNYVH
jgi:hypothetical protein